MANTQSPPPSVVAPPVTPPVTPPPEVSPPPPSEVAPSVAPPGKLSVKRKRHRKADNDGGVAALSPSLVLPPPEVAPPAPPSSEVAPPDKASEVGPPVQLSEVAPPVPPACEVAPAFPTPEKSAVKRKSRQKADNDGGASALIPSPVPPPLAVAPPSSTPPEVAPFASPPSEVAQPAPPPSAVAPPSSPLKKKSVKCKSFRNEENDGSVAVLSQLPVLPPPAVAPPSEVAPPASSPSVVAQPAPPPSEVAPSSPPPKKSSKKRKKRRKEENNGSSPLETPSAAPLPSEFAPPALPPRKLSVECKLRLQVENHGNAVAEVEWTPAVIQSGKRRVRVEREVVYRIIVPSEKTGRVIGKEGCRIQQIKEDTGAFVKRVEGSNKHEDQVFFIRSKDNDATFCDAEDALHQIVTLVLSGKGSGLVGRTRELRDSEAHGVPVNAIRLVITSCQALSLIGVTGQNIRKLTNSSGANITLLAANQLAFCDSINEGDLVVQVSGGVPQVIRAVVEISRQLRLL